MLESKKYIRLYTCTHAHMYTCKAHSHYLVIRVMFKSKTGALKEEFWEDKNFEDEELVKMGEMENFQSLRKGSI